MHNHAWKVTTNTKNKKRSLQNNLYKINQNHVRQKNIIPILLLRNNCIQDIKLFDINSVDSNRNYSSGPRWKILCNYSLKYIARPLELQCKQTVIQALDHWNYSVKYSVLYRETNMFLLRNQNDTMIEYLKLWNFIKGQITVTWT